MKRILKVNKPGLYLELSGISPRRTPAEIDITKCNLNTILTELRKYGIEDYEIKNFSKSTYLEGSKPVIKKKKEDKKEDKYEKPKQGSNSDEFSKKLSFIEELLLELNEKIDLDNIQLDKTVYNKQNLDNKKEDKNIDDEESEDFIPDIDLSGLKLNK